MIGGGGGGGGGGGSGSRNKPFGNVQMTPVMLTGGQQLPMKQQQQRSKNYPFPARPNNLGKVLQVV